ncbi:hypothetical protein NQZ68_016217 [Dissostichus eleginoides]|nr:hypothetical protein NQZ68_016217 [Dissostichus eleginoides]
MAFAQLELLFTSQYTGSRNQAIMKELHHLSHFCRSTHSYTSWTLKLESLYVL